MKTSVNFFPGKTDNTVEQMMKTKWFDLLFFIFSVRQPHYRQQENSIPFCIF
jgi:hypothetical protein